MQDRFRSWFFVMLLQLPFAVAIGLLLCNSDAIKSSLVFQTHSAERIQMCNEAFDRLLVASFLVPVPLIIYLLNFVRKKFARGMSNLAVFQTFLVTGLFYAAFVIRFLQYPICQDDSYIDFRYVQNWFNGTSFDYNPGERVMGFTSHLHVILLYVLSKIFQYGNIVVLSVVLNASLSCFNFIGLHALCSRLFRNNWQPLLACAIFTFSTFSVDEVSVGKETMLVNFLILSALLGLSFSRWPVFAWSSTLLALARPEGVFWLMSAVILSFVRCGKDALRIWIFPSVPIVLVYGFLISYYGTVIPHGAVGRSTMFQHSIDPYNLAPCYILCNLGSETFGNGLLTVFSMLDYLANAIRPMAYSYFLQHFWLAKCSLGLMALMLVGILGKDNQVCRFYFYVCVLVLTFFSISNPFIFSWYFCWFNLVPPLAVTMLAGSLFAIKPTRGTFLIRSLLVVCFAYLIVHPLISRAPIFTWLDEQDRIICYQRAADFINGSNPGFTRTLATGEPGAIGYFLIRKTKVIDLGGLQSPESIKGYPIPRCDFSRRFAWNSIPVDVILEQKPDLFLSLDIWTDNGVTKNETFMQDYSLVHFWPCTSWGARGVSLFIRRDRIPEGSEEYSPGSAM